MDTFLQCSSSPSSVWTRSSSRGPVSAKALRNAHLLGEAWHSWRPAQYRPVEIVPEAIVSEAELRAARCPNQTARAIAAFSGGVDSTFVALRHSVGMLGNASFPLADVVIVHGFDVHRENTSAFDELLKRTKPLTDSLDLRVHVVRTDIREQLQPDWEHSFGAMLASILHQFSDRFEYGLIGSGEPYSHPVNAWGSTPATDYLLSGGHFEIVHEGAGYTRTEKVELVASHPVARRTIKVCWAGPDQGRNCGTCDKCVRTRLNFMAVGYSAPECFDTPFDPRSISSLTVTNEFQFMELETSWSSPSATGWQASGFPCCRVESHSYGHSIHRNSRLSQSAVSGWHGLRTLMSLESHRSRTEEAEKSEHPGAFMDFHRRAQMYRYLICSVIEQAGGPVRLLGEMPGNIGDHLIWAGTEQLLDSHGIPYTMLPVSEVAQGAKRVARGDPGRAGERRLDLQLARMAPEPRAWRVLHR